MHVTGITAPGKYRIDQRKRAGSGVKAIAANAPFFIGPHFMSGMYIVAAGRQREVGRVFRCRQGAVKALKRRAVQAKVMDAIAAATGISAH